MPTRIFHAVFAVLVTVSWLTGQFGGSGWRQWHFWSGYALLALLLFRLLWGFAGDRYARFSAIALSPRAAWRSLITETPAAGHSAAAWWSVIAMLGVVGVQVVTGLFATDGMFTDGPWTLFVTQQTVDRMTSLHTINRWLVLGAVTLHLVAVAMYAVRCSPLVTAIFSGDRHDFASGVISADDNATIRLRAAILLALAAALTAAVVMV